MIKQSKGECMRYFTTWGEPLYTIKDLSQKSNVTIGVLKEWFEAGDLQSFITIYESESGRRLYRWGAPLDWETPLPGTEFVYDLSTVYQYGTVREVE